MSDTYKPMDERHLREVLDCTNNMVRNSMRGPFWPELEEACRAIEATATAPLLARIAALERDLAEASKDAREWRSIESAPYETNVLAWLYLPKNPIASAHVIAQRVYVETDEPESYKEHRRTVGCWWANGMYYPAGHVRGWQPLPPPPEQPK